MSTNWCQPDNETKNILNELLYCKIGMKTSVTALI